MRLVTSHATDLFTAMIWRVSDSPRSLARARFQEDWAVKRLRWDFLASSGYCISNIGVMQSLLRIGRQDLAYLALASCLHLHGCELQALESFTPTGELDW